MRRRIPTVLALLLGFTLPATAQEPGKEEGASFGSVTSDVEARLEEAIAELNRLRDEVTDEQIPLTRELNGLEGELIQARADFQKTTRLLDTRTLDLSNLRAEIDAREAEADYLSGLLSDYIRNFEASLHIAEDQLYADVLEAAILAPENKSLSELEVFQAQVEMLDTSLGRLEDALGGHRFDGTALGPNRLVERGTFVLVGPAAIFRSEDGTHVGTAEQRVGSSEPTAIPFARPDDALAAARIVSGGAGTIPLDPTLGNAHKIEATNETFLEHVKKGGPVMVPIFALAGCALLVALYKWIALTLQRKPSPERMAALLDALARKDEEGARRQAAAIKGPVGRMLAVGVEHLREPRELVEEAMYETVLTTRLRLQSFLPFIATCAASAPLLGLLGTVTGIINTFKLITVYGSGDVKTLSGGISEALITTKFGLIVAVPSLLMHAFLSRKARGIVSRMETTAVAFVNQVARTPFAGTSVTRVDDVPQPAEVADPELKARVQEILQELMITPSNGGGQTAPAEPDAVNVPQAAGAE